MNNVLMRINDREAINYNNIQTILLFANVGVVGLKTFVTTFTRISFHTPCLTNLP